ncbi:exopolysaccharide biosynthesis protein [Aestuariirhabdus sp. LZHN29]|uniref:exopolysaccharide biosynthesis protein n=1 Tax=Aestuariirhabdus sp. LZHN29 TaxID=3417462 RepID=UPI003CE819CC
MKPIFIAPEERRRRTSDVLVDLANRCSGKTITLRELMNGLGDRTYGVALIILAAFNIIPFVSTFSGLIVALIGTQLLFGFSRLYLPDRMLDHQLPAERVRSSLTVFSRKVITLEKFIRPRWHFTEAPIVDRFNGMMIMMLGVVIALPIPFANFGPAFVLIIMALGLLERDGVVQVLAAAFGFFIMGVIYTLLSNSLGG